MQYSELRTATLRSVFAGAYVVSFISGGNSNGNASVPQVHIFFVL